MNKINQSDWVHDKEVEGKRAVQRKDWQGADDCVEDLMQFGYVGEAERLYRSYDWKH